MYNYLGCLQISSTSTCGPNVQVQPRLCVIKIFFFYLTHVAPFSIHQPSSCSSVGEKVQMYWFQDGVCYSTTANLSILCINLLHNACCKQML